ncbi:MAG: hypothetical protein RBR42_05060 [Desulfomicrobium sp.]|nr:hypothetical protein [Desulfomicrobium sp.]
MDITALKDTLGDEKFTELEAHIEKLTGQRDAARKESIDGRHALKGRVAELEEAQNSLLERLGLESLDELKELPDVKGQAEVNKQMEVKLKRLEKQLTDAANEKEALARKHQEAVKTNILSKAMADFDFVDRDVVGAYVAPKLEFDGDDLLYRDGDGLVPVKDGLAALAKSRPALLKAPGAGGAGVRGTGSPTGKGGTMNIDDFNKLPPKDRAKFMANGGSLEN